MPKFIMAGFKVDLLNPILFLGVTNKPFVGPSPHLFCFSWSTEIQMSVTCQLTVRNLSASCQFPSKNIM